MLLMSVTAVVSHEPMFALNVVEPWNKPAMSTTLLTTQLAIATPVPSVQVAPVASLPPRQYEDAMVFTSSAFELNGDAYVHAVGVPSESSPARRNRPVAHGVTRAAET